MNEDIPASKGRQFICSCGKNYLSYAALFTHIKQKHDGKAPGPIVRPRSERKRGRPRKNPQGQNQSQGQQSDLPQNGISKVIDINNIQKKAQEQQKTKKAAQLLLGTTGGFVAFTAYKPQPIRSPMKKASQSGKKNMSKKGSFNEITQRKGSNILNYYHERDERIGSNASILVEDEKLSLISFCQNLQQINKNELKKIFEQKNENDEYECALYDSEEQRKRIVRDQIKEYKMLKKLDIDLQKKIDLHRRYENYEKVNVKIGLAKILKEIKQILDQEKQIKSQKCQDIQKYQNYMLVEQWESYSYQFQQILLFFSIFLNFVQAEINSDEKTKAEDSNLEEVKQLTLYTLTDYMRKFIVELNKKLEGELENVPLFKNMSHIKMMLFIGNWLVVKKIEYEIEVERQIKHQQQKQIDGQKQNKEFLDMEGKIQPEYKLSEDLILDLEQISNQK